MEKGNQELLKKMFSRSKIKKPSTKQGPTAEDEKEREKEKDKDFENMTSKAVKILYQIQELENEFEWKPKRLIDDTIKDILGRICSDEKRAEALFKKFEEEELVSWDTFCSMNDQDWMIFPMKMKERILFRKFFDWTALFFSMRYWPETKFERIETSLSLMISKKKTQYLQKERRF